MEDEGKDLLALPAPDSNSTKYVENSKSLEDLGPIIINSDGSLSRIPNWHQMTLNEQEKTKRLIAKRNEKRKEELSQKPQAQGESTKM